MQDMPGSIPVQEPPDLPPPLPPEQKKSSKTWIIILIVVLVLCCLCTCLGYAGYWLYNNGDALMENIPQSMLLLNLV